MAVATCRPWISGVVRRHNLRHPAEGSHREKGNADRQEDRDGEVESALHAVPNDFREMVVDVAWNGRRGAVVRSRRALEARPPDSQIFVMEPPKINAEWEEAKQLRSDVVGGVTVLVPLFPAPDAEWRRIFKLKPITNEPRRLFMMLEESVLIFHAAARNSQDLRPHLTAINEWIAKVNRLYAKRVGIQEADVQRGRPSGSNL
jgi:hypothetical protein